MFQLTREFIINDNTSKVKKGPLAGKRFAVSNNTLLVAGMANINPEEVQAVYQHEHKDSKNEKVTIAAATSNVGAQYEGLTARLVVTISQEGRVISTVNDQYPVHTKDYVYETEVSASGVVSFAELAKVAAKEEAMEWPDRLITIDGTSDLVIEALDCYTRIEAVRLVIVPKVSATTPSETLTGYQDYNVIVDWHKKDGTSGSVTLVAGSLGAGTVDHILHDLRLQTAANINPYGVNMDERPLPNGKYDQYTIECISERRNTGHQVFGAIDHSLITYVFFVESSLGSPTTSADFKTAIESLQKNKVALTVTPA